MIIKQLHIESFGSLKKRDIVFSDGLNVIVGENESGKSTVATFIKFMLYGLTGRKGDAEVPDKLKFASWDTGCASGSMTVSVDGRDYLIEREYFAFADGDNGSDISREKCSVTDLSDGTKVFRNEVPGAALLKIPEQLFLNTAFVKQLSDSKIDAAGMSEAIENLILSGDESISTKKAVEKLEKERVGLRHKTGSGGLISDLQREELRLRRKLEEVSKESADLIELEYSVEELSATIESREKEYSDCSLIYDAYEKITAKRRLDEAICTGEKIKKLDEKLREYEKYGNIPEKVREIRSLESALKMTDEKLKNLRRREAELEDELPPEMSDDEREDAENDVKTAFRIRKKRASRIVWGIILFLLGAGIVGADLYINPDYHSVFLTTAAILIAVGALLLFTGISNSAKYKRILKAWDADSVVSLEKIVQKRIDLSMYRKSPSSEYGMTVSARRAAEAERISLTTELREADETFVPEMPDTDIMTSEALEKAAALEAEIAGIIKEKTQESGRYSVLSEVFGNDGGERVIRESGEIMDTKAGKTAAGMTARDADTVQKRRKFAENSLPSLRAQYTEKESRLSVLRATTPHPAAVSAELDSVQSQLERANKRYEGLVQAIDALNTAGDNLRRSILPRVKEEAERIMGNFTDGKYTDFGVSRRFDISFDANGKVRNEAYFSAGTKDIAYMCLRLALSHVLFSHNAPPMILDESFARVDEKRLARAIKFLAAGSASGDQSILFTCRVQEAEIAESEGNAKIIRL